MTPRMIVVTGGAGFIGSNIVARLCATQAWDVVVCDRFETAVLRRSGPAAQRRTDGATVTERHRPGQVDVGVGVVRGGARCDIVCGVGVSRCFIG